MQFFLKTFKLLINLILLINKKKFDFYKLKIIINFIINKYLNNKQS